MTSTATVVVNTKASHEVYRKWLEMTRPAPGPGGLRRPLWFSRPVRPDDDAFLVKDRRAATLRKPMLLDRFRQLGRSCAPRQAGPLSASRI